MNICKLLMEYKSKNGNELFLAVEPLPFLYKKDRRDLFSIYAGKGDKFKVVHQHQAMPNNNRPPKKVMKKWRELVRVINQVNIK